MAVRKEELLYLQVNLGNIDEIKALHSEGAGLEWISQGKTPLIAASMQGGLYNVAKTLIELGANVNAYSPGHHSGTPLHHAAEKGLEQTVNLLLSSGATALILNDDSETALDIARAKGYTNIVRAIEKHASLFADWLKEIHGPRFVRHLLYCWCAKWRWVVIMPRASWGLEPLKLELLIYAREEDAKPCKIIPLWKANLEEPNFNRSNPTATISEASTSTRLKFAPAQKDEKERLKLFCDACKGIQPVISSVPPSNSQMPVPNYSEDEELAMAISASLQTAANERLSHIERYEQSYANERLSHIERYEQSYLNISNLEIQEAIGNPYPVSVPSAPPISDADVEDHTILHPSYPGIQEADSRTHENLSPASVPSAPPISDADVDDHAILHPSNPEIQEADSTIHANLSSVFIPNAPISDSPIDDDDEEEEEEKEEEEEEEDGILSSKGDKNVSPCCIICLNGPVEGACIPCGHMIGCMSCLNDLKAMELGCPICRAVIDQVIRIYCAA